MTQAETSERSTLDSLKNYAAHQLATEVTPWPPARWRGNEMVSEIGGEDRPMLEQVQTLRKSPAFSMISSLVATAFSQKGEVGARMAVNCASAFFGASGMIYRFRVADMERKQRAEHNNKNLPIDFVPATFPANITLWMTPRLNPEYRAGGEHSMECVDRSVLVQSGTSFYQSGIRCPWFEKSLIEALVGAETYATIKEGKTNPSAWTGRLGPRVGFARHFIVNWAYRKSRGEEPKHMILVAIGSTVVLAVKLVAFVAAAWYFAMRHDGNWWSLIALIGLGAIAASVILRWLVQLVGKWSAPVVPQTADLLIKNPSGRALGSLTDVYTTVAANPMSVSLAREMVARSYERGAKLDQIVLPFLDRALVAHESLWTTSWAEPEVLNEED